MEATNIVYITAEVVVGLVTVVGNCLVLAAIARTRQLHTITNVFVGNLAVADIAVGLLVAPCAALSFMGLPRDFFGCIFINCLILMFTNVSILMLLSVAVERFLAIKEPFLYHRLLTVRRAVLINLFVWVLGSILGLMPMYGWHAGYQQVHYCRFTDVITYQYMVYFQFFGLVLLPLFLMLCIYVYILVIVRRHLRQTSALHSRFPHPIQARERFNKDVRAAKMFALVIVLFGVFWFPVNIFNCVSLFCGVDCPFPSQALLAAIVMSHANSSINPFLYATSNSRIKGAIKQMFRMQLGPEDRSSTDNLARPPANGTPRGRDNTIFPIAGRQDGNLNHYKSNNQILPFIISYKDINQPSSPTLKMPVPPESKENGFVNNTANISFSEHDSAQSPIEAPRNASNFSDICPADAVTSPVMGFLSCPVKPPDIPDADSELQHGSDLQPTIPESSPFSPPTNQPPHANTWTISYPFKEQAIESPARPNTSNKSNYHKNGLVPALVQKEEDLLDGISNHSCHPPDSLQSRYSISGTPETFSSLSDYLLPLDRLDSETTFPNLSLNNYEILYSSSESQPEPWNHRPSTLTAGRNKHISDTLDSFTGAYTDSMLLDATPSTKETGLYRSKETTDTKL